MNRATKIWRSSYTSLKILASFGRIFYYALQRDPTNFCWFRGKTIFNITCSTIFPSVRSFDIYTWRKLPVVSRWKILTTTVHHFSLLKECTFFCRKHQSSVVMWVAKFSSHSSYHNRYYFSLWCTINFRSLPMYLITPART